MARKKKKRLITRMDKEMHEQGKTIAGLFKQTGISRPVLSDMKNGARANFNESTCKLVGQALNVPHDQLLTLVEV